MPPPTSISADAFRQWLAGQKLAAMVIADERCRWLAKLDEETALSLYLQLISLPGAPRREPTPSPVLAAMRQVLSRVNRETG